MLCQLLQLSLRSDVCTTDEVKHAKELVLSIRESEEVIEAEELPDLALESSLPSRLNQFARLRPTELVSALACILVLRRV